MRELRTQLPFSWYETLANSKAGWTGDGQFLDLFIPALKELEDADLSFLIWGCAYNYFLWSTLPGQIAYNLTANDIALVREYVLRRLRTIKEEEEAELKARESLIKLKEELSKDPAYTGIKSIPEEDKYSLYTVEQFQQEIDWLCHRALEEQLKGNKISSAAYSYVASKLTQRQEALAKKIKYAQAYGGVYPLNNLLGGQGNRTATGVSQVNDITLEKLKQMYEDLKKKGLVK